MKNILILLLLITSLYSYDDGADAKIYTGINVGYFNESFGEDLDAQSSTMMSSFKVGYGVQTAYAVEFSVDWVKNKSSIFSNNDKDKYSINVDFIKAFDIYKYLNPFFKAGFGTGSLKIDREVQYKLAFGSFNVGAGVFIPLNESFDFEIGYNYRYLSYEKLDTIVNIIAHESHVNYAYAGFNVRF